MELLASKFTNNNAAVTRLELMATLLGEMTAETAFCLANWVSANHCGYTACAIGHACLDSRFNELGLSLDSDGCPMYETGAEPLKSEQILQWSDEGVQILEWTNESGRFLHWTAVAMFFDLRFNTVRWMFDELSYTTGRDTTPQQVLHRVNLLMKVGEKVASEQFLIHKFYGNGGFRGEAAQQGMENLL